MPHEREQFDRDHTQVPKRRCALCGAQFTDEALLADHGRLHEVLDPAEREALLRQQGERKP